MVAAGAVEEFLSQSFGLGQEDLLSDLPLAIYVDSLGLIQLISFLEATFEIKIDSSMISADALSTPATLMEWVSTLSPGPRCVTQDE